jgi:hypothetical protein
MDFLNKLFGGSSAKAHPLSSGGTGGGTGLPDAPGGGDKPTPISPKVLAIIHNPIIRPKGGRKALTAYGWQDPDMLAKGYSSDLKTASHGYVNYQIVDRIEVDSFPLKKDGFRYTDQSFDQAWTTRKFHQPDAVDYLALVGEFRMIERVDSGEIDEVWLLGFPYCGYYESIMAGPGAFWCNAPPLEGTQHAKRRFVIMGFNYERGVGEMLEDMGHRVESMMSKVYAGVQGEANLWEKFIRYDKKFPGQAEVGNVHFAPNSLKDYDWGNRTQVMSRADTWLNFPDLGGDGRVMTCADWGDGDIRKHHVWWLSRLPHLEGETNGVSWNWWEYAADPNRVP